jgi:hypothetical protein
MLYGDMPSLQEGELITNGFKVSIPNPSKSAIVRVPTAKEQGAYYLTLIERIRKQTGNSELDRTPELELFTSIRLDKGVEFDEFEADFIIKTLLGVRTVSIEKNDNITIRLKTAFGEVAHTLRQPTFKEMANYRRAISQTQKTATLAPATSLYDALHVSTEGYSASYTLSDIPPDHKSYVMSEVSMAHDQIDPIQIDPNV